MDGAIFNEPVTYFFCLCFLWQNYRKIFVMDLKALSVPNLPISSRETSYKSMVGVG